jgi:hypothetical protein
MADGSGVPAPNLDMTAADQIPRELASRRTPTATGPAIEGNGSATSQRRSRTAMATGIAARKNPQKKTICPRV